MSDPKETLRKLWKELGLDVAEDGALLPAPWHVKTEVGKWISTRVAEQNFIPKFSRIDTCESPQGATFASLAAGQETDTMGIQGISEALDWAFQKGAMHNERGHMLDDQGKQFRELHEQHESLRAKFLKLAEDFQGVIKENERITSAAAEQAVTLATEIEGLKERLDATGADHPPADAKPPSGPIKVVDSPRPE